MPVSNRDAAREGAVRAFLREQRRMHFGLLLFLLLADAGCVCGFFVANDLTVPQLMLIGCAVLLFGFATVRVLLQWIGTLRGAVTVLGNGTVVKKSRHAQGATAKTRSTRAYYLTVRTEGRERECRCSQSTYLRVSTGSSVLLLTLNGKTIFAVEN